ncbi:DedA family protein [Rossellomorea marisflavi]|uniref:DedA family protein n=1 Tax=Rossellomorea marisflavi TaxID=189381 RepID=UPI00285355A2|nr:DedA family protein [Rossellomorea marisflavi]MDR4935529.1 DedA family protein [Rossellomorea marisflavi]
MSTIIDVFLHLDQHIAGYMNEYGIWIYVILFVIIFCETGLVVLPFLPGDSLLFATGALAASGSIHLLPIFLIFCVAAIAGDTLNYTIGHYSGNKVEAREKLFFVKRESLDKTNRFFDKHGSATIILSRFIPIIRTFAPFTAGVGKMPYSKFLSYNVIGGIVWVSIALFAGYFFGNIPMIKDNFSVLVLGIVAVSLLPVAFAFVKNKWTALKN